MGSLSPYGYNTTFTSTQTDSEILDHLIHFSRYDKRDSPPLPFPIPVHISITLLSLQSPDESSLHYEVEFLLHQIWEDPRLSHTKEHEVPHLRALPSQTDLETRHIPHQAWNISECGPQGSSSQYLHQWNHCLHYETSPGPEL